MRHFVTIDANWYTGNSGEALQAMAARNLRKLAIQSGFDHRGFNLSGRMVLRSHDLDIAGLGDRLDLVGDGAARLTRVVVSQEPLPDPTPDDRFDLFITISSGDEFAWTGGTANAAAMVTVDRNNQLHKLETTIIDLLQDVMIANSDIVQAILRKHVAADGNHAGFYRAKASFARTWHETNIGRPSLLGRYEPVEYAALSTLVRGRGAHSYEISAAQAVALGDLWRSFLVNQMGDHFLTAEEAVHFVVNGKTRRTPGRHRQKASISRGDLSRDELLALFGDPQIVTDDDCYVLFTLDDRSQSMIDKKAALFGWRNAQQSSVKQLKLIRHDEYHRALDLVQSGHVTPVVLFLRKPA